MKIHKVGILLSSPLLTAGIRDVLHKAHGISVIDLSTGLSPERYSVNINREQPSLIISDPFLSSHCPQDVPTILLTSCQIPGSERDRYAAVLSIYDGIDSIIAKIRSIVEPEPSADQRGNDLSPRERDVIMHLVKGLSNKEIASAMNVSVNTVMTHRRNIAAKLEIHSPAGLTIFAIATGMVKIEEVPLP